MPRKPPDARRISVKVLPGQPTDGSGQVCIHLFVIDPKGPFSEPHVLHPAPPGMKGKKMIAKRTRGRLACDATKQVRPRTLRNGVTEITMRTDDPRAVTCLGCKASKDYEERMLIIEKRGGSLPQDS